MNTLDPRDRMTTWQRIKLWTFQPFTWRSINILLDQIDGAQHVLNTERKGLAKLQERHAKATKRHERTAHLTKLMNDTTAIILCLEHDIQQAKNDLSKISQRVLS